MKKFENPEIEVQEIVTENVTNGGIVTSQQGTDGWD